MFTSVQRLLCLGLSIVTLQVELDPLQLLPVFQTSFCGFCTKHPRETTEAWLRHRWRLTLHHQWANSSSSADARQKKGPQHWKRCICFIVVLIVAQTRVYTNTDNFFFFFFIYCKRADWKDFPLMEKWEWGLTVRDSNVVEVTQVQEKWDGTGAQNEQEATGGGGGWREKLWPRMHRKWIDDTL